MVSLSGKNWQMASAIKPGFQKQFPEFDKLTLQLLHNRGLDTQEKIDEFFNPDYSQDFFDPFLLTDMKRAVERIEQAVKNKERISVFGDYDADGVTSSVLLMELLRDALGVQGQVYIPHRAEEGYGLNKKAIDWLATKDIQLIITCDCGVSDKEEIDYAKSLGIDVVVTDHHHVPHKYSDDYIIIDPKREGDKYPFKELSGVGIVLKLIQAIFKLKPDILQPGIDDSFIKRTMDLVTIGTVADCSPIISENRTLLNYGLDVIKNTERVGLQALMNIARVDQDKVNTEAIGFFIAPRINAAGRLDHANVAFKLLTTQNQAEASYYAEQLQETNYQRQQLTSRIMREAKKQIGKVSDKDKILFARGRDWPLGVVGIVAGKLMDEYSRPVLILEEGEKESTGSGRSVGKFNLIEAISECQELLLEYGGHKAAAGFSLKNENFSEFTKQLGKMAEKQITDEDLVPKLVVDAQLKLKDIDWDLYKRLQKFEPHGFDNKKPLFMINEVVIQEARGVGKGDKHLKMTVGAGDSSAKLETIGFNLGKHLKGIKSGDKIDIAGDLDCNIWNGTKTLQMKIVDIRTL